MRQHNIYLFNKHSAKGPVFMWKSSRWRHSEFKNQKRFSEGCRAQLLENQGVFSPQLCTTNVRLVVTLIKYF